jgi:hypothetical protein
MRDTFSEQVRVVPTAACVSSRRFIFLTRARIPHKPSGDGKISRTVVPWLSLSRSTWPPSC